MAKKLVYGIELNLQSENFQTSSYLKIVNEINFKHKVLVN